MSRALGLQVIAEGWKPTFSATSWKAGCYAYQGYLFGKPMPIADWTADEATVG
jgi:EAL domain-containing protein (putative c-di-GMP-specific phosphodiesterase class I)